MRSSRDAFIGWWLLLCSGAAGAHGVTLKVHHAQPADSALHAQFLLPWTKQLEQASSGRFRFQLTAGISADAPALLEQIKQGGADIACVALAASGRFPQFERFAATEAANAQDASRALWDYVRLNDIGKQEFDGVRLLAVAAAKNSTEPRWVCAINAGAFKSLTDDLKQVMNANSGAETSAWLGKVFDSGATAARE